MNIEFIYTIISVIAVSLISLAGLFLISLQSNLGKKTFAFLVSFSAGALLGDVFIHLIPELAEDGDFNLTISLYILFAIIAFFLLEKFLLWHHHHGEGEDDDHSAHPFVYNVLIGDAIHNFIDGLIIAGAYALDIRLGVATTIAVILHEIPQEIGDFGVLVYGGFTKAKALIYNLISGASAVLGALVAYNFSSIGNSLPILAALGIGTFIYIAMSDLIPQIQKDRETPYTQMSAFTLGIAVMALMLLIE